MIAALLLIASIVTERNDWSVVPPNYATFAGSRSVPGIQSCWIPYGTYTDGEGGTEYMRVTSNLTGVVASVLDGYIERSGALGYTFGMGWPSRDTRMLMVPATNYYSGATIDLHIITANDTRRIIDVFNDFDLFWATNHHGMTTVRIDWSEGMIEDSFASPQTNYDTIYDEYGEPVGEAWYYYQYGAAAQYGSCRLDELVGGAVEPPIPAEWTTALPFVASASNEWVNVWPVYAALTNDIHILRAPDDTNHVYAAKYKRNALRDWIGAIPPIGNGHLMDPETWKMVWGADVDAEADNLSQALERIPINHTIEDVLKVDPGWRYEPEVVIASNQWEIAETNEFSHWRNGTRRLDWKRLGILCQMERHMEQTYKYRAEEDELPYVNVEARCGKSYSATVEAELSPTNEGYMVEIDLSEVSWEPSTNRVDVWTNDTGWTFPLARVGAPGVGGGVTGGDEGMSLELTADMVKDALQHAIWDLGEAVYTNLVSISNYIESVTTTNAAEVVGTTNITSGYWVERRTTTATEPVIYATGSVNRVSTHYYPPTSPVVAELPGLTNIVWFSRPYMDTNLVTYSDYAFVTSNVAVTEYAAATNFVTVVDHAEVTSNAWMVMGARAETNVLDATTDHWERANEQLIYGGWGPDVIIWSEHIGIPGANDTRVLISNNVRLATITYVTNSVANTNFVTHTDITATTNLVAITNFIDHMSVTNRREITFILESNLDFSALEFSPGVLLGFAYPWMYDYSVPIGSGDVIHLQDFEIPIGYIPDGTNIVLDLNLGIHKSVSGIWTNHGSDYQEDIIRSFTHTYMPTNLWTDGFIAELAFPSLDVMLSTRGRVASRYMNDTGLSGRILKAAKRKMAWDYLATNAWSQSQRQFRMNPVYDAKGSLRESDLNRYDMLQNLNIAVRDRFRDMTGKDASMVEERASIDSGDEQAIMDAIASTNTTAGIVVTSLSDWDTTADFFTFRCAVDMYGDIVENVSGMFISGAETWMGDDYSLAIGEAHWEVEEMQFAGPTNENAAVSVDAHQNQMIKTLWRFKNLRDPNL